MQFIDPNHNIEFQEQLQLPTGPVVLIAQFSVLAQDADEFIRSWEQDAHFIRQAEGFISLHLHGGLVAVVSF